MSDKTTRVLYLRLTLAKPQPEAYLAEFLKDLQDEFGFVGTFTRIHAMGQEAGRP